MAAKRTSARVTNTRINGPWRAPFLEQLSETSNVSAAARKAGTDTNTVYRVRREDPEFAEKWRDALCEGYDNLEMDLLYRLRAGELESAKASAGKERRNRKYDNGIGFRLLMAHRNTVSQERARRDDLNEEAVLASINAKIDRMKAREKALVELVASDNVYPVRGDDAAE